MKIYKLQKPRWLLFILATVLMCHLASADVQTQEKRTFCEAMDYTYSVDTDGSWCYFPDESRCDAEEFLGQKCGDEYLKAFPCVQKSETIWSFQVCCRELVPYSRSGNPPFTCMNPSTTTQFFDKLLFRNMGRIILMLSAIIASGIILILFRKR